MTTRTTTSLLVSTEEETIIASSHPDKLYLYTPSLIKATNGNIVISHDIGGKRDDLHALVAQYQDFPHSKQAMVCRIHVRTPQGGSFFHTKTLNVCHARLFRIPADDRIYLIGHNGKVQLCYSEDHGVTWSRLYELTEDSGWHASACNVYYSKSRLYLCMERREDNKFTGWNVSGMAPHILSASLDADLTKANSWRVSQAFSFAELFINTKFPHFGLPFLSTGYRWAAKLMSKHDELSSSPMGWLEGHVVQFQDPSHVWHDPSGRTLYLFLRCNTAGTGYAAVLKVVEAKSGDLYTDIVRAPSGESLTFVPWPGGHNKFYIEHDPVTQLYWMASTQASDSMRTLDSLPLQRFGLPNNERHRLVLYYSKNCIDWIFAGVVSIGESELHARNYPAMQIDGDDLLIVMRSGDSRARDSQYTNTIMLNTVKEFRRLIY